jgi:flagellar motor switch/type III secretory pathway protein FliN
LDNEAKKKGTQTTRKANQVNKAETKEKKSSMVMPIEVQVQVELRSRS